MIGSPPRVRGKVNPSFVFQSVIRITPACAGKSPHFLSVSAQKEDHPRVCGEKLEGSWDIFEGQGSPPRVRGKEIESLVMSGVQRITPACAGKRLKKALKNKDF